MRRETPGRSARGVPLEYVRTQRGAKRVCEKANWIMVKKVLALVIVAAVCGVAGGARADEVMATHEGLTALIRGDDTCDDVLRIVVEAPDEEVFSGDKQKLNVLLKAVRTRLTFDCPEAEDVLIEGEVDGRKVYRGAFSEGTDWELVDLAPPKDDSTQQTGNGKPPEDKTKLMSLTLESCETKYQKPDFCICAMEQLTKINLSLAEWELISQDFSNVVELSKTFQEIKQSFRACYG